MNTSCETMSCSFIGAGKYPEGCLSTSIGQEGCSVGIITSPLKITSPKVDCILALNGRWLRQAVSTILWTSSQATYSLAKFGHEAFNKWALRKNSTHTNRCSLSIVCTSAPISKLHYALYNILNSCTQTEKKTVIQPVRACTNENKT